MKGVERKRKIASVLKNIDELYGREWDLGAVATSLHTLAIIIAIAAPFTGAAALKLGAISAIIEVVAINITRDQQRLQAGIDALKQALELEDLGGIVKAINDIGAVILSWGLIQGKRADQVKNIAKKLNAIGGK